MNTDCCQYLKCPLGIYGHSENVEVEAEVEVVDAMYRMMNHNSTFTQSSCTWSSSSALWIVCAASVAPYSSHVACAAPYTSSLPPQATFALIHSMDAPDHGYPPHRSQLGMSTG